MNVDYDWRFRVPEDRFQADMILQEDQKTFFTAHLKVEKTAD